MMARLRLPLWPVLFLAVMQPSLAAVSSANWLIGGTWVARDIPCPPEELKKSITPKGMIFSSARVVIQAPPVRPADAEARFDVRYDIEGHHIVAHLSQPQTSLHLDMPFDEVADGLIRDLNGYVYRRCGGGADDGPAS